VTYVDWYTNGARLQTWKTPQAFFDALHEEFRFTLDGASDPGNALLPRALTAADIFQDWAGERVFCNPPWSHIAGFVELAAGAELAVLLVPARVNARWFHRALNLGASVRFFLGRPRFGNAKSNSPVDCLLLVFGDAA
jgi:site-specific DNA-methyltransferase (adenine-specific)